ncbi:MFS transporter [Novosphingobium guangzhouense]|uniref:MFS transporter n=1 Tax=Novosphingobium guangzhouense TaxID=1850347 RepID=A0A2K2FXJ1_9SPHN|nr:MFS transporter [Novosphingobium guangzhouense]PNU03506.1 MFS transporter [Novosphingobium guangzhouense]
MASCSSSEPPAPLEDIGRITLRRITWRLMPLLCLLYLVAYIDRQNVAFAKLQMVGDLGLSEAAYGLGSALFFLGYCIFEIPSNLILERVGPRLWFARIIGAWGLVTLALAFAWTPASFYALRFLLGVAEAGFFPGVLYLLTLWFPQAQRARAIGLFLIASTFANAVGAGLGGLLLELDGVGGLRGWQWVFIATAVPALLQVPLVLTRLPRRPEDAPWLTGQQKAWLASTLAAEGGSRDHGNPLRALGDRRVIVLCLAFVGFPLAAYGLSYWLPTIVRGFGVGDATNGLLNMIPWIVVAAALWGLPALAARSSGFRRFIVAPAFLGAFCLVMTTVVPWPALQFAALCVAAAAIFAGQPFFWVLPGRFLSGAAAAAGFAAINSVGNLGGFLAQTIVPRIHDATGSDLAPMLFLATMLALSGTAIFLTVRLIPRS